MFSQLNTNDLLGFCGVTILLLAFLLHQLNRLSKDGWVYIVMNIIGAGLACVASYLIHYLPFVLLEGTWALASLIALVQWMTDKKEGLTQ